MEVEHRDSDDDDCEGDSDDSEASGEESDGDDSESDNAMLEDKPRKPITSAEQWKLNLENAMKNFSQPVNLMKIVYGDEETDKPAKKNPPKPVQSGSSGKKSLFDDDDSDE